MRKKRFFFSFGGRSTSEQSAGDSVRAFTMEMNTAMEMVTAN